MGVRSSCAASAVNRRSDSSSDAIRAKRPFRASITGAMSDGASAKSMGCIACGVRSASIRPSLRSGANPRSTAHQAASASNGSATSMGPSALRNTAHRISARELVCSPTYTSTSRSLPCAPNTRQDRPSMRTVAKPGRKPCGGIGHGQRRCIRGAERETPFVEYLERNPGRVAVQHGRIHRMVVVLDLACLLHDEQRRRLRQMTVEELVELVLHVEPGERRRDRPHPGHESEHEHEQASPQRTWRADHGAGPSRNNT